MGLMEKGYRVFIEKNAIRQLRKIDKNQQLLIYGFIKKNLEGTLAPRIFGRALKGNLGDYWRYRIGDYRLIAEINDEEIRIIIIGIGHRRDIYR